MYSCTNFAFHQLKMKYSHWQRWKCSNLKTNTKNLLLYKGSWLFHRALSFFFWSFIHHILYPKNVDLVRFDTIQYLILTAFIVVCFLFCQGVKIYSAHKICWCVFLHDFQMRLDLLEGIASEEMSSWEPIEGGDTFGCPRVLVLSGSSCRSWFQNAILEVSAASRHAATKVSDRNL